MGACFEGSASLSGPVGHLLVGFPGRLGEEAGSGFTPDTLVCGLGGLRDLPFARLLPAAGPVFSSLWGSGSVAGPGTGPAFRDPGLHRGEKCFGCNGMGLSEGSSTRRGCGE